MRRYILALDQGTTSSRAILFDEKQNIIGQAQKEFTQLYPKEGWVEHDPIKIYSSQCAVMLEVVTNCAISPNEIAAIGIANQRETTVVWNKSTGKAVYNAIVWQCRRTADIVEGLVSDGLDNHIRRVTGLVPDAYFSATKIKWILDNVPGARESAQRGELLFGTIDTWLIWKLTGAKTHATDYTNASRTMLYDIHKLQWDDTLLKALDIPRAMLPEVRPSGGIYGYANIEGALIPIAGVAGDQQAALYGQCCFTRGEVKNTYGTGCFLLAHTGSKAAESDNGLLTTLAASAGESPRYALEGSVFTGGAVIQWLRDELGFLSKSSDAERLALEAEDNGGVYMVPAFTGLGAPHWDMYARGAIIGITRGTRVEHIVRAAQEAIAYQSLDLVRAMQKDMGESIKALRVDGGASRDAFLMQFQADIMNVKIIRPRTQETTALGAAALAGLTVGLWANEQELLSLYQAQRTFLPNMSDAERERLLNGWQRALKRSLGWAQGAMDIM